MHPKHRLRRQRLIWDLRVPVAEHHAGLQEEVLAQDRLPQRRRQGLSRSERRPLDEGRHCQRHSTLLRMPRGLQRRDGYRLGRLLENLRRRPADADGDALAKARERWHAVPGSSRAVAAGRHDLRRHAELRAAWTHHHWEDKTYVRPWGWI